MKRIAISVLALACMGAFAVSSLRAGGECCKSKAAAAKTASCDKDKAGCCGGKDGFPSMAIKVGDKTMSCPMEAEKVAKESSAKIVYIVGEEKFDCKEKAFAALADEAETYVDRYTRVACVINGNPILCDSEGKSCSSKEGKTCSKDGAKVAAKDGCCKAGEKAKVEGAKVADAKKTDAKAEGECCMKKAGAEVKYMVLGKIYEKKADAEAARDEAMAAVKKISMKAYMDGKEVECDKVCPDAAKAGKVEFAVGGEKTHCQYHARIMTAKAKYEAAKSVLEKKMAKA